MILMKDIIKEGNPILRQKCCDVEFPLTETDEKTIKNMIEYLINSQDDELANKYNLPIVIHTREAIMDTINILKNKIIVKRAGVFHCCPQNKELIKEALKLGFYISFAGPITFKSSKNAKEIVNMVPIDRILIETDSPYLSPEPNRGKRNDSTNVKFTAAKIAEFRNITLEEVASATYKNANKIFSI